MGTVYSYHTFLYPFLWENSDGDCSIDAFESKIDRADWSADDMVTSDNKLASVVCKESFEEQRLDYQKLQYFSPTARKALFGCGANIVHGWKFRSEDVHNVGEYRIYYSQAGKPYILNINHIRLRLFNTGVGILVFELEYALPEGDEKKAREQARYDVRAINEFGRRLYPEFIPTDKDHFPGFMFAEAIEIALGDGTIYREDIRLRSLGTTVNMVPGYINDPFQKCGFIAQMVLKQDNSDIHITPAVDDRMFTCCCIIDQEYSEHFLGHVAFPKGESKNGLVKQEYDCMRQRSAWRFKSDWEIGKELYALVNVDKGDSSCQNREMIDKYFEEQLYLRWLEYGTIQAVTNHSMFCICGSEVIDSVINPFLIEYVQLCILTLAQRASLIAFDERITNVISSDVNQEEKSEAMVSLANSFAIFQGQILIPEATSQIQGIELYGKLQKMLFIDKLRQNVLSRMSNLYEVAQYEQAEQQEEQQKKTEMAFNLVAILAIFSAVADGYVCVRMVGDPEANQLILAVVAVVVALIARRAVSSTIKSLSKDRKIKKRGE